MFLKVFLLLCFVLTIYNTEAKTINHDSGMNSSFTKYELALPNASDVLLLENQSNSLGMLRKPRSFHSDAFFRVGAGETKVLYDRWSVAEPKPDFMVTNLGQTAIFARYVSINGDKVLGEATLQPGQTANFDLPMGIDFWYRVKVEVRNLANDRIAFVYAEPKSYSDNSVTLPDLLQRVDASAILKQATLFGLKMIPYVGSVFSFTVGIFWPEQKQDIWNDIKDQVQDLIDQSTSEAVNGILNGRVKRWEKRLKEFDNDMNSNSSSNLTFHYLNIAQDFIGVENEFSSMGSTRSNFFVVPFYSTVVLMKVMFYTFGINCQKDIGLSAGDISSITRYRTNTLTEANDYLPKLYADMLEYQYQNLDPKNAYTTFADIRTLYSQYGSEYIKIWNQIVANTGTQIQFDEIHYSRNVLGTQTGAMNALLTKPQQPFTPNLVSPGKRNKLVKITACWGTHRFWKLSGLRLTFQSGETYDVSWECKNPSITQLIDVDLSTRYINKVEMKTNQNSFIVQLKFHFTDNSAPQTMGQGTDAVKDWSWSEEGSVLSSLYTTPSPGYVCINLMVAYQRNNVVDDNKYLPAKCKK